MILTFKNLTLVPWQLQTIKFNCLQPNKNMNFEYSHICYEGNSCVDLLASHELSIDSFIWYNTIPHFIR
jgi:hypothetical protein